MNNDGINKLSDTEALEFALSFSMPGDNSKTAQHLLETCGSLSAVVDAPYEILRENGISENAAVFMRMIPDITKIYLNDKFLSASSEQYLYSDRAVSAFIGSVTEQVLMILTDKKDREIYFGTISTGSFTSSEIHIRQIVDLALKYRAAYVYLAHNHPSGIAFPSEKDISVTKKIRNALNVVGITLKDHFIIADMQCFSMAQDENFESIFQ